MKIVYIKLTIVRARVKLSISIVLHKMFSAVSVFTIDIILEPSSSNFTFEEIKNTSKLIEKYKNNVGYIISIFFTCLGCILLLILLIKLKLIKINKENKIMPIVDPKDVILKIISFKRPKDYVIEKIEFHRKNIKNLNLPKDYLIEKIFIKK